MKDWGCMHVIHIHTNLNTWERMPRCNKVCFKDCYSRGPYHYHCRCGLYYNYYIWYYLSINAIDVAIWRTTENHIFRHPRFSAEV